MKIKLIITILLTSGICFAIKPLKSYTKAECMKLIALQESGDNAKPNRNMALHKDGVSYGRYGVTYRAVAELKRTFYIPKGVVYNLTNEWESRKAGRLYLEYCKDRFRCSWFEAIGYYHSFTKAKREKYLTEIKKSIKL